MLCSITTPLFALQAVSASRFLKMLNGAKKFTAATERITKLICREQFSSANQLGKTIWSAIPADITEQTSIIPKIRVRKCNAAEATNALLLSAVSKRNTGSIRHLVTTRTMAGTFYIEILEKAIRDGDLGTAEALMAKPGFE